MREILTSRREANGFADVCEVVVAEEAGFCPIGGVDEAHA